MTPPLWFANLIAYCLQVMLVVLAGTLLLHVFRLRLPRVLLAYWQALLAVCLVLPALQPWKVLSPAALPGAVTVSVRFDVVPGTSSGFRFSWYQAAAAALLLGMLVRLAWLALGMRRLRAIRRGASLLDPLPESLRDIRSQFDVEPVVYVSSAVGGPATFGVRPASILMPERFVRMPEPFQRAILCHEILHVARRDWVFNLFEELALTVFWFHPAVAWLVNRIRLSREQVVDAEVVRLTRARKPYLNALLEIASTVAVTSVGAAPTFLRERQLANRIELLAREVTMTKLRLTMSLAAITGFLVFAGGFAVWAFPLKSPAKLLNSRLATGSAPAAAVEGENTGAQGQQGLKLVHSVPPVYPPLAKAARIQGKVVLYVDIDGDGVVQNISVVSGHPLLVKAAIDAVRHWRYQVESHQPTFTDVTVNFTLSSSQSTDLEEVEEEPNSRVSSNAGKGLKLLEPLNSLPPYPPLAKQMGIQGTVVLEATVEKDGSVSNIDVVSGHPLLVKAALDAVKDWRYEALASAPVKTTVTMKFSLSQSFSTDPTPAATPAPDKEQVVDSHDKDVVKPVPIYKPEPKYTKEAKDAKVQGTVILKITIDAQGNVTDVKVTRSLEKSLDESAVQTVRTWKFKPALKDGKPVACKSTVEITFKLF